MKNLIFISFLIGMVLQVAAGGGWPKKKGEGYFKLGQGAIFAKNYYTAGAEVSEIPQMNFFETYLYGEYGVTNRFTAIGYIPLFAHVVQAGIVSQNGDILQETDELSSIGDFSFSFKYGIVPSKRVVWSAQLNMKLPTGQDSGGESRTLQTGDGAFSQMLQTDVSTTFGNLYASVMLGIRHRGADYSDDWHAGFEVGWSYKSSLYLILKIKSQQSFLNNEDTPAVEGVFSNNQSFVSVGPEIHYFFQNGWGLNASVYGAFMGKNILAAPYMGLGLSYNLFRD